MVKRNKMEQIFDILSAVRTSKQPTRVMYAANLEYKTMMKLLKILEEHGLVEKACKKRRKSYAYTYQATNKGLEALKLWHQLQALLGGVVCNETSNGNIDDGSS